MEKIFLRRHDLNNYKAHLVNYYGVVFEMGRTMFSVLIL